MGGRLHQSAWGSGPGGHSLCAGHRASHVSCMVRPRLGAFVGSLPPLRGTSTLEACTRKKGALAPPAERVPPQRAGADCSPPRLCISLSCPPLPQCIPCMPCRSVPPRRFLAGYRRACWQSGVCRPCAGTSVWSLGDRMRCLCLPDPETGAKVQRFNLDRGQRAEEFIKRDNKHSRLLA